MKTISKFHQSFSYMMGAQTKLEMSLSVVGGRLIGKSVMSHPTFPTITSIFEGLIPSKMSEHEDELKEQERMGKISKLTFGTEMCVSEVDNETCQLVPMN